MDKQEQIRVRKDEKRYAQQARGISLKIKEDVQGFKRVLREAVVDGCGVCIVREAMKQFAIEEIDHMGWDTGSAQLIKTSPQTYP